MAQFMAVWSFVGEKLESANGKILDIVAFVVAL